MLNEQHTLGAESSARIEEVIQIGRRAAANAQQESRRLGVPNVCSNNDRIYYEIPNGELSLEDLYLEAIAVCQQS